jgi:4-hydroxy-tetrahydrodipicolinate reductase
MGERVRAALEQEPALRLGAAVEAPGHPRLGEELAPGVGLGTEPGPALAACDVAIAFATPAATLELLRQAAAAGVPAVVGTTGFSERERVHLARRAADLLGPGYDAEIVELHHAAKVDAPSGTALRLGAAVAEGRGERLEDHAVLTREGGTGARPEGAIGIQTLRGGDNPGEHSLLFLGAGERLELSHRSATRDHFARGAVRAALWLLDRPPGLYDMEQVLGLGG